MMAVQLPQNDKDNADRRQKNLQKKQKKYRYKYNYPSLCGVPMAVDVPRGEYPTLSWIWRALKIFASLVINVILNFTLTKALYHVIKRFVFRIFHIDLSGKDERPRSVEDYIRYFKFLKAPLIAGNYKNDGIFGRMRVAGQNPVVIERITAVDENFPVTDKMFQSVPGFGTDTLDAAGADNRLYLADYVAIESLKGGVTHNVQKYIYPPKALFAIPAKQEDNVKTALLPIAIQCDQIPAPNNPIFTPSDGVAWEIAKTIVQAADFSHHELITHLAATHLLMEPFVVSTHRQLAKNHPLNRLLMPHFEGTIFINWGAQKGLVADGAAFDEMFGGTMYSNRGIVGKALQRSFNEQMLPITIKRRGVDDPKLFYPYRDDALEIWEATAAWVSAYVDVYYKEDKDIAEDTELHAWVHDLIEEGLVRGFGDDGEGAIKSVAYLKEAVTMIIFTASTQHSAVNFSQKDFSGYPPAMPASGYIPAPEDNKKTKQDFLNNLPPTNIANDQVNLTYLLSGVEYTVLGQYKQGWFEGGDIDVALKAFQEKLINIETRICARNEKASNAGVTPYDYMKPSRIPQSINI